MLNGKYVIQFVIKEAFSFWILWLMYLISKGIIKMYLVC